MVKFAFLETFLKVFSTSKRLSPETIGSCAWMKPAVLVMNNPMNKQKHFRRRFNARNCLVHIVNPVTETTDYRRVS